MKRADSNYSAASRQVLASLLEIIVPSPKPQRAELLPGIFCVIKWVCLESKMVFFFFFYFGGADSHPVPLQQEIRWVTATWWNDCIFPVRGPQGDSERRTSIYCFAIWLPFFFFPFLCVSCTHAAGACAEKERESVSPDHPVDEVQRLCGVKPWPSPDWKVLPPGRLSVHCHSQSSNLRGQRLLQPRGALHYKTLGW